MLVLADLLHLLRELLSQRGFFLPLHESRREVFESLSHHVHVPALEEHDVPRRRFGRVLLQRVIDAVLPGRSVEGLDIAVRHLDVGDGGVLCDEMLDRLLSPISFRLLPFYFGFFEIGRDGLHRLGKLLAGKLAAPDGDRNHFPGDFLADFVLQRHSSFPIDWCNLVGL